MSKKNTGLCLFMRSMAPQKVISLAGILPGRKKNKERMDSTIWQ